MPPDTGKLLARHLLSPGYEEDLDDLIKARKQAIISLSDSGPLLANDQRQGAINGNISIPEKQLGEGQFIFLHLVITPDNTLEPRNDGWPFSRNPPNDNYGFAFELDRLSSLDSYYRCKDLYPKFDELWQAVIKKDIRHSTGTEFDALDKDSKTKLLEDAENIRTANTILLAPLLKSGELQYPINLREAEAPEILVRGKLDIRWTHLSTQGRERFSDRSILP